MVGEALEGASGYRTAGADVGDHGGLLIIVYGMADPGQLPDTGMRAICRDQQFRTDLSIRQLHYNRIIPVVDGDGLITGLKIALTYAILTSAYFAILLATVGPKLMQQEGETSVVKAFLGISIGFALFGAVFSAIIALVLRRR